MKFRKTVFFVLACATFGCEEVPDICIESKPSPVIYSAFDKHSEKNYVIVTKTFSGDNGGTLVNAKIWDSIYFEGVEVNAIFYKIEDSDTVSYTRDTVRLKAIEKVHYNKENGIFLAPASQVFEFDYSLKDYQGGSLLISIPNYETINQYVWLIDKPKFEYPSRSGTAVKILPNDPVRFRWKGDASSDIRIVINILTKTSNGTREERLVFDRKGILPLSIGGNGFNFHYSQLVGLFTQYLEVDPDIYYRSINNITLIISNATVVLDPSFHWNDSYTDSHYLLSEGKQSVYGLVFSRSTDSIQALSLHYLSKERISSDPELTKYKFSRF